MRRFRDTTIRVRVTVIAMTVTAIAAIGVYALLLAGVRLQTVQQRPDVLDTMARRVAEVVPQPMLSFGSALGIPLLVALVGMGTWRVAGRTLRPVETIRTELDEITATDLTRRVPLPPEHDEMRRLAESVNATLDRLQSAVIQQRRFVSDVSHELRSPLTGLRAELELALLEAEDETRATRADLRATLRKTLGDAERLQHIVSDLLILARRDAGLPCRTELTDLGELAAQEVRRRPRRVPITVHAEPGIVARVNPLDLARVLTNLLDNAARHAATAATLAVRRERDAVVIEVSDDGEGVPPEHRERIFERFTRLPDACKRDPGGTGLGLPIARDIATAHRGTLTVADSDRGARFVLRLPLHGVGSRHIGHSGGPSGSRNSPVTRKPNRS